MVLFNNWYENITVTIDIKKICFFLLHHRLLLKKMCILVFDSILILDSTERASSLFCLFVYGANSLMIVRFLLQSSVLQHLHILVASTRNLDFIWGWKLTLVEKLHYKRKSFKTTEQKKADRLCHSGEQKFRIHFLFALTVMCV